MNATNLWRLALLTYTCAISISAFGWQNAISSNNGQQQIASTHPDSTVNRPSETNAPSVPAAADPSSYIIGPADVVTIRVWHEPDLSAQSLPVRPDGKVSLALLNDIQAAGLTPMQLGQKITAELKKYVSDPQVTVVVDAINSKRIYVIGQVERPGAYPLLPEMNVLQALSGAGGFLQYANPKRAYVLRHSEKLPFNYKQALKGQHLDREIILQPGDTIVVP